MEWKPGRVVKNLRGHDKGFYAVVAFDGQYVYIANGRSRLLEKPKRKNPRHLAATAILLLPEAMATDKKLRAALWPLNFGDAGEQAAEERESLG